MLLINEYFHKKVNESEKYQYSLTNQFYFPIKNLSIYIFFFLLSQEKTFLLAKSLQFNVNYSHTRVSTFTVQLSRN